MRGEKGSGCLRQSWAEGEDVNRQTLVVLDSTHPDAVRNVERRIDLGRDPEEALAAVLELI